MRMFLTRVGLRSKAVVTGDVTQVDLPRGTSSGLSEANSVLGHINGLARCFFTSADVVRHPLVQRIVDAYDDRDARTKGEHGNEDGRDGDDDGTAPADGSAPVRCIDALADRLSFRGAERARTTTASRSAVAPCARCYAHAPRCPMLIPWPKRSLPVMPRCSWSARRRAGSRWFRKTRRRSRCCPTTRQPRCCV